MISRLGFFSSLFTRLLFSFLILILIPTCGSADSCQKIVGNWKWFVGGTVEFTKDRTAKYTPEGRSALPPGTASWTCDRKSKTYTVNWSNGYIDTLNLSPDGKTVTGTSTAGVVISGTRYTITKEQMAASTCKNVLGDWNWFNGGKVTFSQDNTVVFTGSSRIPNGSGTWACDPVTNTYSVTWIPGFNETLTMSPDGTKISGTNMVGQAISGTRPGTNIVTVDCSQASNVLGQGTCGLVSAADICKSMGKLFSPGQRIQGDSSDSCRFNVMGGFNEQVEVGSSQTSRNASPFQNHRAGFMNVRRAVINSPSYIDLPGVGEVAYIILDLHGKRLRVHILNGNRTFLIRMKGLDYRVVWNREDILASAKGIALDVVKRGGVGSPPQPLYLGGDPSINPGYRNPKGPGFLPQNPWAPQQQNPGSTQDVQPLLELLPPAPP